MPHDSCLLQVWMNDVAGYGRMLREAVVDEAIDMLRVVMLIDDFRDLVGGSRVDMGMWERQGRIRPVLVGGRRYVSPALVRVLLCDLGRLSLPLPSEHVREFMRGTRSGSSCPQKHMRFRDSRRSLSRCRLILTWPSCSASTRHPGPVGCVRPSRGRRSGHCPASADDRDADGRGGHCAFVGGGDGVRTWQEPT